MLSKLVKGLVLTLFVLTIVATGFATFVSGPKLDQQNVSLESFKDPGFLDSLEQVNRKLQAWSDERQVESSERADVLAIGRRISLALVGCGLSLEEIRALQAQPESEQIDWLTNYLLQDRRWSDYFAERFSRSMVGTDDGPFLLFRRRRFNSWLAEQIHSGVGYDATVREIIAAEGLWTDTPAVNFVTSSMADGNEGRCDPVVLTGRLSRTFLAQRIDCLQCHDDFMDQHDFGGPEEPIPGLQTHFHELAAFFGGTALPETVFLGIREMNTPYTTQLLGAEEEAEISPTTPFLSELLPEDGKPRQRLATWVTHPDNYAFSRATVNRVWALLFSRPLVEPVDSIPLDDSVPEVLDVLASDFADNGFDLRRLVRMIISTEAFQRDSTANFEITPKHEDCFAVFPISQLRPEQVAGNIIQGSRLSPVNVNSSIITRLISFGERQAFLRSFGDRGIDEFDSQAITIAQRLVLMNGNLVSERSQPDLVRNAAGRIARLVSDDERAVELVYLCVLGRPPTEPEMEALMNLMADLNSVQREEAIGDLYWSIMNSTEFTWNH
jgi:hypothetical protein